MGYAVGNKGEQEDYHEALEWLDKAISIYRSSSLDDKVRYRTEFADSLRTKGFLLAKINQFQKAEEYFEEATNMDEGFPYAWNSRSFFYLNDFFKENKDKIDQAIECARKAIYYFELEKGQKYKVDKSDVIYPYYNLGCALHLVGDYEEAIKSFLRSYEEAIKCFENAIRYGNEAYFSAWYNKGIKHLLFFLERRYYIRI